MIFKFYFILETESLCVVCVEKVGLELTEIIFHNLEANMYLGG